MANLFYLPQAVRVDSAGTPYAGAKANFYLTGTTTPTDTYTDNALSVAHANPVVADSAGQFAAIYLDPAITYRVILTESDNTQIDDVDPIASPLTAASIAVVDTANYFTASNVETVLAEIGLEFSQLAATETFTGDKTFSSADLKMTDNVIERPEIKDYSVTHTAITSTSNAITADCSTGNSFYHLLTENTTLTITNPSPTGKYCQITFRIVQDGAGGAYTFAWPASVLWAGGTAPVISVGNDAIDVITLSTDDAGTAWYGSFLQAFS